MKISTRGRYGARAMIELASQYDGPPVRAGEISEKQDISLKYLEAILATLKSAGLVTSDRGRKGGYSLARSPVEISLFDILAPLEDSVNYVHCTETGTDCERIAECVTREVWIELRVATERILRGYTLADLTARKDALLDERNSTDPSMPGEAFAVSDTG